MKNRWGVGRSGAKRRAPLPPTPAIARDARRCRPEAGWATTLALDGRGLLIEGRGGRGGGTQRLPQWIVSERDGMGARRRQSLKPEPLSSLSVFLSVLRVNAVVVVVARAVGFRPSSYIRATPRSATSSRRPQQVRRLRRARPRGLPRLQPLHQRPAHRILRRARRQPGTAAG